MGKTLAKISLPLLVFFLLSPPAFAHPGRTAADGGHYCWTNCAAWGEVYGQRHFHGNSTAPARSTLDDVAYDKITFNIYHDSDYVFEYQGLTMTLPNGHYPTLRQWEALRKAQEVSNPITDRLIPNKEVPPLVATIFAKVYDRKITPSESTYWKQRARGDKRTELSLTGAMAWHKANGKLIGN